MILCPKLRNATTFNEFFFVAAFVLGAYFLALFLLGPWALRALVDLANLGALLDLGSLIFLVLLDFLLDFLLDLEALEEATSIGASVSIGSMV
jgi:hypothetical protein